jgi:hypothetical protein
MFVRSLSDAFRKKFKHKEKIPFISGFVQPGVMTGDRIISSTDSITLNKITKEEFEDLLSDTLSQEEIDAAWKEWPEEGKKNG